MVTPLNADESLDEPALRRVVNYLIESGVHGLFPAGSRRESSHRLSHGNWWVLRLIPDKKPRGTPI